MREVMRNDGAPRDRLSGADSKPLEAAVIKSHGGERLYPSNLAILRRGVGFFLEDENAKKKRVRVATNSGPTARQRVERQGFC